MEIDTIIFDYGGVIADDYCEPFTSELAKLLVTDRAGIEPLISESSEHGGQFRVSAISRDEFWVQVRRQANCPAFDPAIAQILWQRSYIPNPQMLPLLHALRLNSGIFIGIFSNMDAERFNYTKTLLHWPTYIDRFIVSCETGHLKPTERAFNAVLQACGRERAPERVLFVDDRSAHVVAAERLGLMGYHFRSRELLIEFLGKLRLVGRDQQITDR